MYGSLPYSGLRTKGVSVLMVYVPERSGAPLGIRGTSLSLAGAAAATMLAASATAALASQRVSGMSRRIVLPLSLEFDALQRGFGEDPQLIHAFGAGVDVDDDRGPVGEDLPAV